MSFFHSLSPVPAFSAYTGPYSVGTQEIEIPASELSSSPPPDPSITTISCRIFYPCKTEQKRTAKPVYWLPGPQNEYFKAYARFMQASPWLASLLSYFPLLRPLFHTTVPAQASAPLQVPSHAGRWPLLFFSHGLGGSKNTYSAICGSLASHGLVVIAPDHRDGSSPISMIRTKAGTYTDARRVEYRSLGHKGGPEVDQKRDEQLRIRCWEMTLAYEAMAKLDMGAKITNLAEGPANNDVSPLSEFVGKLDVHEPGHIAWAGHSFGAATVVQFVKSVFYRDTTLLASPSPALTTQVTSASPTAFLDLWALPLLSPHTHSLFERPLPCYNASKNNNASPSSAAPLAILSETFFKWKSNLDDTIRVISSSQNADTNTNTKSAIKPHIFYPLHSAHLSQSDFGPLFPWFTRKVFKAEEPQRTILLNTRAILESLRRCGTVVSETSAADMEITGETRDDGGHAGFSDHKILDQTAGSVRGWVAVQVDDGVRGVETQVAQMMGEGGVAGKVDGGTPDSGYDSPGRLTEAAVEGHVMG